MVRHSAIWFIGLCITCVLTGCGYTNRAITPNGIQSIVVPTFKNHLQRSEMYTYEAGLEIDITNAIIDRFNFDGNLKVMTDPTKADATLDGALVQYRQEAIRFEGNRSVKEHRLFIAVNLTLTDNRTGEVIWSENGFTGRTEYFRTGTGVKTETAAAESARTDLAEKVVDRVIEDW